MNANEAPTESTTPKTIGAFNHDQKAPPLHPPAKAKKRTKTKRARPSKARTTSIRKGKKTLFKAKPGETTFGAFAVQPGQQYAVVIGKGGGGGGGSGTSARGKKREPLDANKLIKEAIEEVGGKLTLENVRGLISQECLGLEQLLHAKNRSYGNSALEPIRVFSKASPVEQIKVRLDDKLKRIASGTDEMNEDTVLDLMGYLVLLRVAMRLGLV